MRYAEVSVNSPAAQRRTFSYAVPPGTEINAGQAVIVPFGSRLLQGLVLDITGHPAVDEVRQIEAVVDPRPLLSPAHIALARWISERYLAPLYDSVSLMLPAGFGRRAITEVRLSPGAGRPPRLTPRQSQVLELVGRPGGASLGDIEERLGKQTAQTAVGQLVRRGLLARSYRLDGVRVRPKVRAFLELAITPDEARLEVRRIAGRARRQAALLDFLAEHGVEVALAEATEATGCGRAVATALALKGLISIRDVEVRRQPFAHDGIAPSPPLHLNQDQQAALDAITAALYSPKRRMDERTFLLHGVTGSGKTEVYLQALAETVRLGKRGIVLVPEISLTPQTVERFASRFPGRVAVLHSHLSAGERYDEWHAIRDGGFDVVIGPRSAVFAPQPELGLVVIDEEHEWTYKQQDPAPRYHAREVARKLAELSGALVVLGSATPDVESYYRAQEGAQRPLRLPERVSPGAERTLPAVEVVDLREELRAGNRSIFSRALSGAIESVLAEEEQAILFLNRRGASSSVQCRSCGHVIGCPNCEISLSYHAAGEFLLCHQCDYRSRVPTSCPECGSRRIKFLGIGTQKLEAETRRVFRGARVLRWDSDVTRRKHSHQAILDQFRNHEADILIGTQMVAKGLDLPRVTLVGVIIADLGLNLPDFRAGERTFQVLCQVAGRAGRSALGGHVIVQTYSPEHYAIKAAAGHDYDLFYGKEIEYRRLLHDPPFTDLARLTHTRADDDACRREAETMGRRLKEEMDGAGIAGVDVIGPGPAFIHRLRGQYRWQIVLRGRELPSFLCRIPIPPGWAVDIDPLGL